MNKKPAYEVIFCIVNSGFAETVMETAKTAGARGGTILSGHGTANKESEEKFLISVQTEKDIIMMVVPSDIKDDVLKALYRDVGLNSPEQGIAFSLPVTRAVGLI